MLNNINIVGRLTDNAKFTKSKDYVLCSFSLAVQRNFKNNEGKYDTDFFRVVASGPAAKFIESYVAKGDLISVSGRLQNRSYDSNGKQMQITEIIVDQVNLLTKANKSGALAIDDLPY